MSDPSATEGFVSVHSDADGIEIVRIIDAPPQEVFEAWTVAERFATWFGEHGSSIPLDRVSMDPRPGGAWSAVMLHGPEQIELHFGGEFREVVEPERVVMTITEAGEPGEAFEGGAPEIVTAEIRDLGDGRTELTVSQRGGNLPPDEYSRAMRGWLIFLERQSDHLKARHDTL